MPSAGKRLKGQREVREKDSFDYTAPQQRVTGAASARAVGRGRSAEAEAMMRFSSQWQGMQSQATNLFAQRAAEVKKDGATSSMAGEDKPKRASDAFIEGYETQEGEAAVADYIGERDALQSKAEQMLPDEYEAASEAINKKFLHGASDNFVRGFVPDALKAGAKYDRDYQKIQKRKIDQTFLSNVRKEGFAKTSLIYDDETITDKPQAIRDLLTAQQLKGKQMQVADRNRINDEFIETLGVEAIRGANPDLMAFTTLKDKDGHALIDDPEMADKINQIINAATAAQTTQNALAGKAQDKALKLAKEDAEKEMVDAWSALSSSEGGVSDKAIISFHQTLFAKRDLLGPTAYAKYRALGVDLVTGNGFAAKGHTDSKGYGLLWDMASDGRLTDELLEWNRGKMDPDYYIQLVKHRAASNKFFSGEEGSAFKPVYNTYVSDLKGIVNQVNPITKRLLDPLGGPQRQAHAYHYMTTKLNTFKKENQGKYPTTDEVYQWTKDAAKDAFEVYGDPRTVGDNGTEGSSGLKSSHTPTNPGSKRAAASDKRMDRFKNARK